MQRPAQDQPTPTPMPIDVNVSEVRVQGQTIPVYQPTHGMVLDEINTPNYKLTRREWNDTIKSDPELLQLHRRGRLMVPGLILSGIGVAILSFSVAVQLDVGAPESATGAYFAYAVPGALIATGLPLAIVGGKNRRMLNDRRARIMAAPTLSRHGGGIGVVARF